ncbi:hypothetical protein L21SP5_00371 [Salinivirga cyanobacteriivorans]|uniref:Uncharacterized protein n=2 Tax=Salinivirga TaxID=1970191 RepID=A0A0S2HVH6_9BACT|nr:hypothetical protein [Salinivirga cyanobacteriivorans]ALO14050.1 hypothetical protein L21SP5_00371 [Salinivirga cyanobacteriivorans]
MELFTYNRDEFGNRYKIHWLEQDWGTNNQTFTVNYSNDFEGGGQFDIDFEVEGKSNDDEAGESYVEYIDDTDGEGYMYSTGILNFWINQQ